MSILCKFMKLLFFKKIPIGLFALVMGLSGLTLCWRSLALQYPSFSFVSHVLAGFSIVCYGLILLSYGIKIIFYYEEVKQEWNHPILFNFFGTFAVSSLLISSVLSIYMANLAMYVWLFGSIVTVFLSFQAMYSVFFILKDTAHVVPAWIIPGVAGLDIAVTSAHVDFFVVTEFNKISLGLGFFVALIFFAPIVNRLVYHHHVSIPDAAKPSLLILLAPFAVGFLAYTNVIGGIDLLASMLFYFAVFLFFVLGRKVFFNLVAFQWTWWAVSFPLTALTAACMKYANHTDLFFLHVFAFSLLAFSTGIIAILFYKTVVSGFKGKLF